MPRFRGSEAFFEPGDTRAVLVDKGTQVLFESLRIVRLMEGRHCFLKFLQQLVAGTPESRRPTCHRGDEIIENRQNRRVVAEHRFRLLNQVACKVRNGQAKLLVDFHLEVHDGIDHFETVVDGCDDRAFSRGDDRVRRLIGDGVRQRCITGQRFRAQLLEEPNDIPGIMRRASPAVLCIAMDEGGRQRLGFGWAPRLHFCPGLS
ncbi:MAG: hypothetical protein U5O39_07490 [Gammaproteobacteria bacterium]|nr:hypothetical protein [Gammaproteobacteria bacterium]